MQEQVQPERRPWYATWFWRSLILIGLGLALVALGEVRVISAGGGSPAPVLPDYTLLLPNLTVLLGSLAALVGAATALVTTCAALLNAVRKRHGASGSRAAARSTNDNHR